MPAVSVIVPNYRHAPFLKRRLDSILQQTYQDFEVIILDDCSPDDSRAVIETYRDHPKVSHIVYNEQNSGSTFSQWEKGIGLASGYYIWIAESDDYASPEFLESLVPAFQKDQDVAIAFCQSLWVNDQEKIVKDIPVDNSSFCMQGRDFIAEYLLTGNRIYNASMAVFKRETYLRYVTGEYKKYKYCGDWLMWAELASGGKVFYLDKKLNHFRRHTATVSFGSDRNGVFISEGLQVQLYIKEHNRLSKKDIRKASRHWLKLIQRQFVMQRILNFAAFNKALKLLRNYDKYVLVHFPGCLLQLLGKMAVLKMKRMTGRSVNLS